MKTNKEYLGSNKLITVCTDLNKNVILPIDLSTNYVDLYKLTKGKKLIFRDSGEEILFDRLSITYNNEEDKWYYTLVVNNQLLEINLTDEEGEILLYN